MSEVEEHVPEELLTLREEVQRLRVANEQLQRGRGASASTSGNGTTAGQPICLRCRKPGHIRRQCRQGQRPRTASLPSVQPEENSALTGQSDLSPTAPNELSEAPVEEDEGWDDDDEEGNPQLQGKSPVLRRTSRATAGRHQNPYNLPRVILEALVYSSRRTQASAWRVNIYAIISSVTRAAGLHWLSLYKAGSTLMLCPFSSGNHTGRDTVLQQVDGGRVENEISQEDRRQNPPQTDSLRAEALTDSQQCCYLCFPDIHAALRELTATVTEQKANIRDLETRLREELNKKADEISALTQSQVEELKRNLEVNVCLNYVSVNFSSYSESSGGVEKEFRDREIAFSSGLLQSSHGDIGPFTTDITIIYRNVFTNIGNAYSPITGIFTAPLKFAVFSFGQSYPSTVTIMKNGQKMVVAHANQAQGVLNSSKGVVLILEVGDVVYVRLWANTRIQDNGLNHNAFSGYLLFPLG
ncbi:hypothetical protein G5714_023783 [Onychostoma macrolepis]|uniref:CCHC-type domain-containing protein n=1 Tax=Onychostoma macrolepis TaxID=369639 RepID=A0A7J6BKG8_9TELE|nr:hypothetical protein G5714_023783 [Onychostoma macrolepis]